MLNYNYIPLSPCTCGTMKVQNEYQQQEYVMQFLMELNQIICSC
jgi:hypothetical protein